MLLQGTDPNSKEPILFQFSERLRRLVEQQFDPTLYKIREVRLSEEESHYADGSGVAAGEVDPDQAIIDAVQHRFEKVIEIHWNGKLTTRFLSNNQDIYEKTPQMLSAAWAKEQLGESY